MIQKLCSIIAIEVEQGEGQSFFDLFDLFQDLGFFCVPDGSLFTPGGGNIYTVNFTGELPDKDSPQWATA